MTTSKVSIITINYNNASGLQKTMESVFAQNFKDYEYIVIDGGSTDGSTKILENYTNNLMYWISKKDEGIYNAMNKGIDKANTNYILFLNSGDYFYSSDSIRQLFANSNGEDIVYTKILLKYRDGKELEVEFPDKLTFGFFYSTSISHQGTLIKKELFQKIGHYSENYKIVSDWEFFMKAITLENCSYKYIPQIITVFLHGGISTVEENITEIESERHTILKKDYSAFFEEYDDYFKMKLELKNYKNSRLHQLIEKFQNSSLYKMIKV